MRGCHRCRCGLPLRLLCCIAAALFRRQQLQIGLLPGAAAFDASLYAEHVLAVGAFLQPWALWLLEEAPHQNCFPLACDCDFCHGLCSACYAWCRRLCHPRGGHRPPGAGLGSSRLVAGNGRLLHVFASCHGGGLCLLDQWLSHPPNRQVHSPCCFHGAVVSELPDCQLHPKLMRQCEPHS